MTNIKANFILIANTVCQYAALFNRADHNAGNESIENQQDFIYKIRYSTRSTSADDV